MDANLINAAIEASLHVPFEWGKNDCCTFVCDGLAKATGSDPMASLRGAYCDEAGADVALSAAGGFVQTVIALAKESGFVSVTFPFNGADFGIVATQQGPAMAFFLDGQWIGRAQTGVVRFRPDRGLMAWKVN